MTLPAGPPPEIPAPLLARLTASPGAARMRALTRAGTTVVAVPGRYSVTYLVAVDDAVIVVDIGSVTDHARIDRAMAWLGRPLDQVRCVVPTHLHMDHVIGIDAFARRLGVPVALGPVAYEAVTGSRSLRFPGRLHTLRALPTYVMQGAPSGALGDWRVGLDFGFPWSRNRFQAQVVPLDPHPLPGWEVLETPGHADDAICLHHAEAGYLVAGDTVRNFTGGEWNPLLCDRAAYEDTKRRLLPLPVTTAFPGHGPILEGPELLRRLQTRGRFQV